MHFWRFAWLSNNKKYDIKPTLFQLLKVIKKAFSAPLWRLILGLLAATAETGRTSYKDWQKAWIGCEMLNYAAATFADFQNSAGACDHIIIIVIGCLCVCVSVPKDLANHWTNMVLLYNVASQRFKTNLGFFLFFQNKDKTRGNFC